MRTYHYNGEYWYSRNWSILHWIRNWIIWIGGWEKANGKGWSPFYYVCGKRKLMSPAPVALLGHRLVFYGWGWSLRTRHGWLVKGRSGFYWSPSGTPDDATTWIGVAPHDVVVAAEGPPF